jgi:diguanylate cyclase (GGDEF)-like protein
MFIQGPSKDHSRIRGKCSVDKYYNALRQLRLWSQPAVYVGVAMIVALWVSVNFHLAVEYDRSRLAAFQITGNLARVFEEHIVRILMDTDRAIVLLRSSYLRDGNFDLVNTLTHPPLQSDLRTQIRVLRPDGVLIAGNTEPFSEPVDYSDRDYFHVHLNSKADELFVSKPVFGRTSGKWWLQLSRSIRAADGSFQGVIGASLDPNYLASFYQSIDLGGDGSIILAGLDGVVRASAGFKNDNLGSSMLGSQLFRRIAEADTGSFLTSGVQDGIRRFVSYRVVKGFPLVVYVGQAEHEVLASYWYHRSAYFTAAGGATAFIVIVVGFAVRYRRKLDAAGSALQSSEAHARNKSRELEVTLEHMNQGIMMVDADRNVMVMNRRVIELLGLPEDYFGKPVKLDDVLSHLWTQGGLTLQGNAPEPKSRDLILAGGMSADGEAYECSRPNGMMLEIHTMALPDGGVVRTITDVSERKRRESQIAYMARHDALTNLANRTLLNERIEQALARMRRQHEGFALFCLDLDRFKNVNDTRGHPAGDALLRSVADRLTACVREIDTVARLGGDEFAILQAATEREEDAELLARRVLEAVSAPYDLDGYRAVVGISIGIAMAPGDGTNLEALLKAADISLYRAKLDGGNAYDFFGRMTGADAIPLRLLSAIP